MHAQFGTTFIHSFITVHRVKVLILVNDFYVVRCNCKNSEMPPLQTFQVLQYNYKYIKP